MIVPKITLFIILATMTGCHCLFNNLLYNIGRTVQGVYKCSKGLLHPPIMPNRNFDLRIELKDGRARIWLPENRPPQWKKQINTPRPFSLSNLWKYSSGSYPNYSGMQSRTLRDLSSQNNLLRFQNQRREPSSHLTPPVYQTGFTPVSASIQQENRNRFSKYSASPRFLLPPPQESLENFVEQELSPPQLTPNQQNFDSDLNLPFDFRDVNNLAEINHPDNVYRTIPYSEYIENQIGNGLMENEFVNNGHSNFDTEFTNRPFIYNPNIPTANIDSGFGQIPLYK